MNPTSNEPSLCDMLIANAAKDAQRHIAQQKFLEAEIKTLIGAIRTATDLESLRAVANQTAARLRNRSLEMEKARIQAASAKNPKT
jgi:hypothetical protein